LRVAAVFVWLAATGCSKEPAPPAGPPPDAKRVDVSTAGRVSGRVVLEGPVPQNPPIKIEADPFCQNAQKDGMTSESFVVKDGALDNAFVYVKDGLGSYVFDVPTAPVTLAQQGCRYGPHVVGVRVNQPIEITTADATIHNVHALAKVNSGFNFGQQIPGEKQRKTFVKPEVMVEFKCDVHSWMRAYAGVLPHPYFAVSGNGGMFELKDVPPGTYTIEAWHEKLGTQTQTVTLGEKDSKEITFTFKAPTS